MQKIVKFGDVCFGLGSPISFITKTCQLENHDHAILMAERVAFAVGIAGLFIETHQDPDNAPCDEPNMIQIDDMPALIMRLCNSDALRR